MLRKPAGPASAQRLIRFRQARNRRGVYTLWTILMLPALLLLFIFLVDIAQLWLARVELENALEAAALAAVKEWAETSYQGVGWTLTAREIGVEYAAANTINGIPVVIDTNYNPEHPPNENDTCEGNLVFGAIIEEENIPCPRYIFNAGLRPSCAVGNVLFDASGQGNLNSGNHHEWGIAFQKDESTPDDIRIVKVTIDLGANNDAYFDIETGLTLADFEPPFKVNDGGLISQPDLAGFPNPMSQILWQYDGLAYNDTRAKRLIFTFQQDPVSGDLGFEPCDRFRFGQNVVRKKSNSQFDGDDIGDLGVTVTVEFSNGSEVSGTFWNTWIPKGEPTCGFFGIDPFCSSIIVHPFEIPDLPCPPVPGQGNNPDGQSIAQLAGEGRDFGVRAQATVSVDSLLCRLCGISFGPFDVSACTTAMYDCDDRRPRLIRVEREDFICPGP